MNVFDKEQVLNSIINTCNNLKEEYKISSTSATARAWEKHLLYFDIPGLYNIEKSNMQERRIVDILSPLYPADYTEEITY